MPTSRDLAQKNQYQVGNNSLGVPFLISVTVQLFFTFSCFGRRAARRNFPKFQKFKKEHPGHVSPMANGPCEPYVNIQKSPNSIAFWKMDFSRKRWIFADMTS